MHQACRAAHAIPGCATPQATTQAAQQQQQGSCQPHCSPRNAPVECKATALLPNHIRSSGVTAATAAVRAAAGAPAGPLWEACIRGVDVDGEAGSGGVVGPVQLCREGRWVQAVEWLGSSVANEQLSCQLETAPYNAPHPPSSWQATAHSSRCHGLPNIHSSVP